jgi:hypothetical protein
MDRLRAATTAWANVNSDLPDPDDVFADLLAEVFAAGSLYG